MQDGGIDLRALCTGFLGVTMGLMLHGCIFVREAVQPQRPHLQIVERPYQTLDEDGAEATLRAYRKAFLLWEEQALQRNERIQAENEEFGYPDVPAEHLAPRVAERPEE